MSADKPAPAEARAAFHFEVHGPGRDYDYSVFCEEHNNEATDCAAEWLAEAFDAAEVGEDISVKMRVVRGKIDIEEECVACAAESAAPPASEPALLPTLGRVMQERGHYESNDDNCGGCSECERIAKERDKASEPATACPSCGSDAPGDDRIDDGDGTHTIYSRVSLKRGGGDAELCPDAFHATRPPAPLGWRERAARVCDRIHDSDQGSSFFFFLFLGILGAAISLVCQSSGSSGNRAGVSGLGISAPNNSKSCIAALFSGSRKSTFCRQ